MLAIGPSAAPPRLLVIALLTATAFLGASPVFLTAKNAGESAIRGRVVVFLDPGCPIARFHTATLRSCHRDFTTKGIQFEAYVPNRTATEESVAAYAKKFRLPFPVHPDADLTKARQLKARTVPEVFLFDDQHELLYRGRIDDIYVGIGKKRPRAQVHDLRRSLEALVKGEPIPVAKTVAIGCAITF